MSSNKCELLPVCDVEAELVDSTTGLLPVAAFFRTTSDPRAPRPPRVPTLFSQLSNLARFTPAAEVSCKHAKKRVYWVTEDLTLASPVFDLFTELVKRPILKNPAVEKLLILYHL